MLIRSPQFYPLSALLYLISNDNEPELFNPTMIYTTIMNHYGPLAVLTTKLETATVLPFQPPRLARRAARR